MVLSARVVDRRRTVAARIVGARWHDGADHRDRAAQHGARAIDPTVARRRRSPQGAGIPDGQGETAAQRITDDRARHYRRRGTRPRYTRPRHVPARHHAHDRKLGPDHALARRQPEPWLAKYGFQFKGVSVWRSRAMTVETLL